MKSSVSPKQEVFTVNCGANGWSTSKQHDLGIKAADVSVTGGYASFSSLGKTLTFCPDCTGLNYKKH